MSYIFDKAEGSGLGALVSSYPGLLKKGSKGDNVARVQIVLDYYGAGIAVDGDYGTNTFNAVKSYQEKVNKEAGATVLGVDGKVGDKTWAKLMDIPSDALAWVEGAVEDYKKTIVAKKPSVVYTPPPSVAQPSPVVDKDAQPPPVTEGIGMGKILILGLLAAGGLVLLFGKGKGKGKVKGKKTKRGRR